MIDGNSTRTVADDASPRARSVLRVCVGAASSPLSSVWKVCVRGDDIYIFSSALGSDLKASIHASGSSHWSVSAEWFVHHKVEFRNQERYVVRWTRRNPEPMKAAHIFRIILPASELRPRSAGTEQKKIIWLSEPQSDAAWEVELYLTPPHPGAPSTARSPYRQLGMLQTQSGKWVAVLAHLEMVTPEKARTLTAAREGSRKLVAQTGAVHRELRAIGFLQSPDNPPGLIELMLSAN